MSFIDQYTSIIKVLNDNEVDYMVVGGFAVNFHGYSRSTMDMDIWVDTSEKNLKKLFDSFISLEFEKAKCIEALQHLSDNHMIKIPLDRTKIELLDSFMIKHDFQMSYRKHEKAHLGTTEIKIIGFDDLIACKKKSSRMKDLLDVKYLAALKKLRG